MPALTGHRWFLYVLRTRDDRLYTGITTDVARRLGEHSHDRQRGARALRGKAPLQLLQTWPFPDRSSASRAEYRVKNLSRTEKEALVAGRLDIVEVLQGK